MIRLKEWRIICNGSFLDTHTLIWLLNEPKLLSQKVHDVILTSDALYVSVASLWEIAIKAGFGKLDLWIPFSEIYQQLLAHQVAVLAILPHHLSAYKNLPLFHRDPFNRIPVAQAITDNLTLVSKDR